MNSQKFTRQIKLLQHNSQACQYSLFVLLDSLTMAALEPAPVPALHVMVAGLPRNGKSTGLKNIFDLDLPAGLSATPITDKVVSVPVERNGVSLTVTDTPGLKAAHANKDKATLKEMKRIGKNKVLLLLTLSVSPSSCITEDYCNILGHLNTIMGPEIWNWCLVLLTFSDSIRESNFHSDQQQQGYQDYLKGHCGELQNALAKIGVLKVVKPFFEYTREKFDNNTLDGIVAIPVGKDPEVPTKNLLPLQPWTHENKWTDLAFIEITKLNEDIKLKTTEEATQLRIALIQLKCGSINLKDILDDVMEGMKNGKEMGEEAGKLLGPIIGALMSVINKQVGINQGIVLGNKLGPLIGGLLGALCGGGIAACVCLVRYIIQQIEIRLKEKELRELEHK